MFTNSGFGLLRVLGSDVSFVIGFTIFIVIAIILADYLFHKFGDDTFTALKSARVSRNIGLIIWVLVMIGVAFHVASTTASLRIPRSDVNATSVYQQMDSAIEGKPTR